MNDPSVELDAARARFRIGSAVVGEYVLDDPFKPYFHPLRTIGGRVATLAMPSDHRHHKGLMYALTATDVNWWEETGIEGYVDTPGTQTVISTINDGDAAIIQEILWTAEGGAKQTFRERRTISCAWEPAGFVRWTWAADFETLRPVTLRQSIWSQQHHGQQINYHGLGIRFPREFGFLPDWGTWEGDGVVGPAELMGRRSRAVRVTDLADGEIPAPKVTVRLSQVGTDHGWFAAQSAGFCYLSVGPTILPTELELAAGDTFHEEYLIDVADGELTAP